MSYKRPPSRKTHGAATGSGTPEYKAWRDMKVRCYLPTHVSFKNYGGRGITVCDQWRNSFETFLADVGLRPSPNHSLDRKKNDENYEPGNVVWSTKSEQAFNRRKMKTIQNFSDDELLKEIVRRGLTRRITML